MTPQYQGATFKLCDRRKRFLVNAQFADRGWNIDPKSKRRYEAPCKLCAAAFARLRP